MRINNNIMAMNTHRQFAINNDNVAKATEKLSSGYRVNRAGDDAAGLAISEKMRAQIKGLNMASKNSQDAISLVQTAEGALTETHSILQRMRELSVQSSSDTNQDAVDRVALNAEFQALKAEIDDIANKTAFNDMKLLNGSFGSKATVTAGAAQVTVGSDGVISMEIEGFGANDGVVITDNAGDYIFTLDSDSTAVTVSGAAAAGVQNFTVDFGAGRTITMELSADHAAAGLVAGTIANGIDFTVTTDAKIQTGANTGETLNISIDNMGSAALGITGDITDRANAQTSLTAVNAAINTVSSQRANLGALQNRLQHKINNLDTSAENLQAAESRIRDLDMAKEMTEFTKNNILVQAATSMLAQANAAPQGVLQLLQ